MKNKTYFKCDCCGQFISNESFETGAADVYFQPDDMFGAEQCDCRCAKCVQKHGTIISELKKHGILPEWCDRESRSINSNSKLHSI